MHPRHCQPELATTPALEIIEGSHPLLPGGVRNSIRLGGSSALVTGSNMAGKTTFVKMLAINAILGRTAGFCLAARAMLPRLPVMAAIHGGHSVEAGKSHYFAEIEAIRGFLESETLHGGGLFVLDEPFSGTNTAERIAIASAVLRALGQHSLVLVTTHDVELQGHAGRALCALPFPGKPGSGRLFRLSPAHRRGYRAQRHPAARAHGFPVRGGGRSHGLHGLDGAAVGRRIGQQRRAPFGSIARNGA